MKWRVEIDERIVEIDSAQLSAVTEVEPGVYSILIHGASYEVRVIETAQGLRAEARGRRFKAAVLDPRDGARSSRASIGSGRQSIAAPMPGKVIRVLVKKGDAVEAGSGLVVVEAMKMQNEMKTPRPAQVVEVRVQDGDTVAAGQTLLVLE